MVLKEFLISPNLPDLVAYIIMTILFIYDCFIKAFVKKDNKLLKTDTDVKLEEIKKMKKELEEEKTLFEKDKLEIRKELEMVKKAVRITAGNTHELVSSGIANKVAKIIPEEKISMKEENVDGKQEL